MLKLPKIPYLFSVPIPCAISLIAKLLQRRGNVNYLTGSLTFASNCCWAALTYHEIRQIRSVWILSGLASGCDKDPDLPAWKKSSERRAQGQARQ